MVFYRYARERAATTRLPYPFVPIRDRLVLPCFRAVEAVVQFLFSDRPVRAPPPYTDPNLTSSSRTS